MLRGCRSPNKITVMRLGSQAGFRGCRVLVQLKWIDEKLSGLFAQTPGKAMPSEKAKTGESMSLDKQRQGGLPVNY